MKTLIRYFIQGLLFWTPIFITVYIIFFIFSVFDRIIPALFNVELTPGLGILIVVVFLTTTGSITSMLLVKPAFSFLENYVYKIPFINIIYSSSKDVVSAIVGEKKRFDHPVMVKTGGGETGTFRIGFVTRDEFNVKQLETLVAVYFPHSYNISGNILFVPKDKVLPLNITGAEAMKFIVSAGMTGNLDEK
ncbi:DUF502 domain-containing protein [Cytophaga hutchinsonii]|jgi:uncharacterized membrane protein|uniref:DUF502 domain-containing protein n=1 Tax=Cytophaga hutchinsonii (strain ATCC 33406 / DSM 1761 / CIP 103989 / NBRC 15051 / NCIMB 9469 / D465) TaxID=269798 RepID=A0A6N4SMA8_CYTH3|nr:DUF502 domain-containing protein [Cytophaga hutchinsonii]ABG57382.1 conserved hypothetical protein; possible transmembrane protein [Cytophaga hutchinsonii ATCC 33406]SFX47535.1 Uncharacterized membrane protein [Cytophaga hutchinsonii ATCC 33406]